MTHEEALDLLPLLSVDAVDEAEASAIWEHVGGCESCRAELSQFEDAAARLADAAPEQPPPAHLRARVVAGLPAAQASPDLDRPSAERTAREPGRILLFSRRPAARWLAVAAVLLLALAGGGAGWIRDTQARSLLRTDRAALALLTSTETTDNRLEPIAPGLSADAHGHWFHRVGVPTQVVVGEFLPAITSTRSYAVWQQQGGQWILAGALDADGRLVILGSDGNNVSVTEVTLESGRPAQPTGPVMLRFPG